MPNQIPISRHNLYLTILLLLSYTTFSITLFLFSFNKYYTWHLHVSHLHRTNDLIMHTTLFIATCAPLSGVLGIVTASLYYARKRSKYGRFEGRMRRKGRGYWVDPQDEEDRVRVREASGVDKGTEGRGGVLQRRMDLWRGDREEVAASMRRHALVNPYGWSMDDEGVGGTVEMRERSKEGGLSRSESMKTCGTDEVVKKGLWIFGWGEGGRGVG
ncbi:hypothetical protein GQ44DRAFT_712459, partial [Phaeosphaeriaceae sp. PMI808]